MINIFIIYSYVATEAHDDDGLPHTLEHLIFLGSEDYPYKVQKSYLLYSLALLYYRYIIDSVYWTATL